MLHHTTATDSEYIASGLHPIRTGLEHSIATGFIVVSLATGSSPLHTFPWQRTFHKNRFAVVGDAAVGMNPGTAHGFNLGLLGTNILAQQIKQASTSDLDFASRTVLAKYTDAHRRNCLPLYHGTNFLIQLYTNQSAPAKVARHMMLRAANKIVPVRKLIMSTLTDRRA